MQNLNAWIVTVSSSHGPRRGTRELAVKRCLRGWAGGHEALLVLLARPSIGTALIPYPSHLNHHEPMLCCPLFIPRDNNPSLVHTHGSGPFSLYGACAPC